MYTFRWITSELLGSTKNVDPPFCSKSEQNGLTLWQWCFQKNSFEETSLSGGLILSICPVESQLGSFTMGQSLAHAHTLKTSPFSEMMWFSVLCLQIKMTTFAESFWVRYAISEQLTLLTSMCIFRPQTKYAANDTDGIYLVAQTCQSLSQCHSCVSV